MLLKENIANVAFDLFARNGIKRVSMDDVARKSNVSKRTLYEFYSDKETLLIESMRQVMLPFRKYMDDLEKQSYKALEIILLGNAKMIESQTWICQDFCDDIKRFPNANDFWEEQRRVFLNRIIKLFNRGVKEKIFLSDVNFDIISYITQERFKEKMLPDIYKKYTHEEVHNTILFIFLRGICTDDGRKILDRFETKHIYKHGLVVTKTPLGKLIDKTLII